MQSNLLLCELHAHTTWSDGFLTMTELVDLYGRNGFDVLCVTDHLLRSDSTRFRLRPQTHALCSVDDGLEPAMRAARDAGAAIVAAHPHGERDDPSRGRTTRWFSRNWQRLDGLVDRYELFNRRQTFGWVAEAGLPGIATGDFHRLEHLRTWKTLLPCAKNEQAVIDHLRSSRRAYVVPWGLRDELRRPLAA